MTTGMASVQIRDDMSTSSYVSRASSIRVNTPFKSTVSTAFKFLNNESFVNIPKIFLFLTDNIDCYNWL